MIKWNANEKPPNESANILFVDDFSVVSISVHGPGGKGKIL